LIVPSHEVGWTTLVTNIYMELTKEFNEGRLRAIVSSGQAVVLHRVAIMSKDGDWILREDTEAAEHVLGVLSKRSARYRFGAPLDVRWLRGGWSSHFEFRLEQMRVRVDFVSRPPRINVDRLAAIWREQEAVDLPVVPVPDLAELKKTNRERDYAVIGELARLVDDPTDQLLLSRSARDLVALAARYPDLAPDLALRRPLLASISEGREATEIALDAERRQLMRANERRLLSFADAAKRWMAAWPDVSKEIDGVPLPEAHRIVVERAEGVLPNTIQSQTEAAP
jgi:hypothetical protein